MLLLAHISIASCSLIFSTVALFFPSEQKLKISYGFIALTFFTGSFLVFQKDVSLTHVCITGLTYLAVVLIETDLAHRRLAAATK